MPHDEYEQNQFIIPPGVFGLILGGLLPDVALFLVAQRQAEDAAELDAFREWLASAAPGACE